MRSVILPELPRLSRAGGRRSTPLGPAGALPIEEIEELRRMVRFVCTSLTLVGVCGRARSAAAAAAEESDLLGFCLEADMKADAAAVAALGFTVAGVRGYGKMAHVSIYHVYLNTKLNVGDIETGGWCGEDLQVARARSVIVPKYYHRGTH